MSENEDLRVVLVDELRAGMPPIAGQDAQARVKARALASEHARTSQVPRRTWRVVGSLTAAAVVVATAVLLLGPRVGTAAFAREQAADALLLHTDGRVLHVVTRYTETGWNEQYGYDSRYDVDQRWSVWIDPEGKRIREEFVNVGDGSLDGLSVRVGDRIVTFQNNVRYMTGSEQQLIDEDGTEQPFGTAMGTMIDYLRARIDDGSATVTGSQTIDGEEYWVVEWKSEVGDITLTATMRKSDYRLKTWAQDVTGEDANGTFIQKERLEFETMEQLEPETLATDFFSFDQVISVASPETQVEKR